MSILLNNKLRTILTSINPETVSLENQQDDLNANGFTIFAGQVSPKIYLGPSTQAEDSSEASSEYISNEAKTLSKIIKGDLVGDVEAPDFLRAVDNLMKKVNDVVSDPSAPDTPMTEAFRNANKNRNRNRNRGHGRGHHD